MKSSQLMTSKVLGLSSELECAGAEPKALLVRGPAVCLSSIQLYVNSAVVVLASDAGLLTAQQATILGSYRS